MTSIDARLLLPGDLFLDPLDQTEGVFVFDSLRVNNTFPHADGTAVPAVRILAHRQDDMTTEFVRVLDPGSKVTIIPGPPRLHVTWDAEMRSWSARVSTSPGTRLTLELNDAAIYDGDIDAETAEWAPDHVAHILATY